MSGERVRGNPEGNKGRGGDEGENGHFLNVTFYVSDMRYRLRKIATCIKGFLKIQQAIWGKIVNFGIV